MSAADGTAAAPAAFTAGRASHRDGDLARARTLYEQALREAPEDGRVHHMLGLLCAQMGEAAAALHYLAAAVRLEPENPAFLNNLGNAQFAVTDAAAAAESYRQAVECRPDFANAWLNLGNALGRQRRLEEACAAYERVLALEPGRPEALLNLGAMLYALARFPAAEQTFRSLLEGQPDSRDGWFNLALVLHDQDRLDEAADACQRLLALDPGAFEGYLYLGNVRRAQGRLDEAIAVWERAAARAPRVAALHQNLASAWHKKADYDKAMAAAERALALQPDSVEIAVIVGDIQRDRGDPAAAVATWKQALGRTPGHARTLAHMGIAMQEAGAFDEAARVFDFDGLIRTVETAAPPGYADHADFHAALAAYLRRHPTLLAGRSTKTTIKGHQSDDILHDEAPVIAAMREMVRAAVGDYLDQVFGGSDNPWVPPPPESWDLNGWCVILHHQGHQLPHHHPGGVVSGVYYVELPDVVKQGRDDPAGCIRFGPSEGFTSGSRAQDGFLTRTIRPREGLMVLFPSWFWHHTIPFEGHQDRICVAFDVLRA